MKILKIILLDNVYKLGNVGSLVKVKVGYARNFLFPQGKAIVATKRNILYYQNKQCELREKVIELHALAKERIEKISKLDKVTILVKTGIGGKLFGAVTSRDIASAITNLGIKILKSEIRISSRVLRALGDHEVKIQLHPEVYTSLIISLVALDD